jgi:hypothetical protein
MAELGAVRDRSAEGRTAGLAGNVDDTEDDTGTDNTPYTDADLIKRLQTKLANLPDGAALMKSPRYRYLFGAGTCRPQLARIAQGERITLPTKYGPRDSGSEQVAVVVANLLTVGKGVNAPPEDEIRAIALYMREQLRPGYDILRYLVDVDRLICKYRPDAYSPEETYIVGMGKPSHIALMSPRQPVSTRADRIQALHAHIATLPTGDDGYAHTTTAALASALTISVKYTTLILADMREAGILESKPEARGIALRLTQATDDHQENEAPNREEGCPTENTEDSALQTENQPMTSDNAIGSTHAPRFACFARSDCLCHSTCVCSFVRTSLRRAGRDQHCGYGAHRRTACRAAGAVCA